MMESLSARSRPLGESAAVVLTGSGFVVSQQVSGGRLPFIGLCAVLRLGYIVLRVRRERRLLAEWGLRLDNLALAVWRCLPALGLAAAGIVSYRLLRGWMPLPASSIALFVLYPIWALVQQLLVQSLLAQNLRRMGLSSALTVAAAALVFGLMHAPDWTLVPLCAAAGAAWTLLFLRTPNLIPLALSHGWLGVLAYYWVLERTPWTGLQMAGS